MIFVQRERYMNIAPFREVAYLAGLMIDPGYYYLSAILDGKMIGFCAYTIKGKRATLRNALVFPEYRNRGVFTRMNKARLEIVKDAGCTVAIASCSPMVLNIHLKYGATRVREYKHSVIRVEYRL